FRIHKAAVHDGARLPGDLFADGAFHGRSDREAASRIRGSAPGLGPLLGALSWHHAVARDGLGQVLDLVARHAGAFAVVARELPRDGGIGLGLVLLQLARRAGGRHVEPLLAMLGDERAWRTPLSGGAEHLTRLRATFASRGWTGRALPARPAPTLGAA